MNIEILFMINMLNSSNFCLYIIFLVSAFRNKNKWINNINLFFFRMSKHILPRYKYWSWENIGNNSAHFVTLLDIPIDNHTAFTHIKRLIGLFNVITYLWHVDIPVTWIISCVRHSWASIRSCGTTCHVMMWTMMGMVPSKTFLYLCHRRMEARCFRSPSLVPHPGAGWLGASHHLPLHFLFVALAGDTPLGIGAAIAGGCGRFAVRYWHAGCAWSRLGVIALYQCPWTFSPGAAAVARPCTWALPTGPTYAVCRRAAMPSYFRCPGGQSRVIMVCGRWQLFCHWSHWMSGSVGIFSAIIIDVFYVNRELPHWQCRSNISRVYIWMMPSGWLLWIPFVGVFTANKLESCFTSCSCHSCSGAGCSPWFKVQVIKRCPRGTFWVSRRGPGSASICVM